MSEQAISSRSVLERARRFIAEPITARLRTRVAEFALSAAAAWTIDHTALDATSRGYAADVVGTTAFISFLAMFYRKGDPRFLPVGAALVVNGLVEQSQAYGTLAEIPVLNGLDGRYDVRDFAAFAAGSLLYLGIEKCRQIASDRQNISPSGSRTLDVLKQRRVS